MRVAVAAIFKNEAPYILEWISHHKFMGFTDFVIADNNSDDGTTEILSALDRAGVVKHIPFLTSAGQAPQMLAYRHLLDEHLSAYDWVAFIDADEFIKLRVRSILDLVKSMPDEAGGIILNWSNFGSSGHISKTPGMVIERFRCHAKIDFQVNKHFKSIIRPKSASVGDNPHTFRLNSGLVYYRGLKRSNIKPDGTATLTDNVSWEDGCVNHYIVKSREEFFFKKRPRGRGTISELRPASFFDYHNRNDEIEAADYAWLYKIDRGIQDLITKMTAVGYARSEFAGPSVTKPRGSVDKILIKDNYLIIRGWAVDENYAAAYDLGVQYGKDRLEIKEVKTTHRPDVVQAGASSTPMCGFEIITVALDGKIDLGMLKVFASGHPIQTNPQAGQGASHTLDVRSA